MRLSQTVEDLEDALSISFNQLVYDLKRSGQDVITLSLGEAFFDIPLFDFNRLDIEKIYHYSDTKGIPALRQKIAEFYGRQYGAPVDRDEIMITAGSKPAIFMSALAVLDDGDEALIHEPAWLSYPAHVKLARGKPRFIPYDTPVDRFGDHFGERTKLLVLCNPNNPGGHLYSRSELETIYALCQSRGAYLLVDEAYSDFVLDGSFVSMASVAPDKRGVIIANSLSKNMGMSGWRVGYTIADADTNRALEKLNQHLITCAPTILTYYMAEYFDEVIAHTLPQVRQVVEKRGRIAAAMDELGLQYLPSAATFYFFVDIGDFPGSSIDFALELLMNSNIAVVPGLAYGDSVERFVRVSVGSEPEERICDALVTIKRLIADKAFSSQSLHERFRRSELSRNAPADLLSRGAAAGLRRAV